MEPTTTISATGPAAFGVIAERFRRAGQPEKAVTLCREGLEQFPDHLSARVTLGWSLLDMGEFQEAFDQLKSVNKRAPDNLAAIRGLAELHERGIGLVFDAMPDSEQDLDPHVAPHVAPDLAPPAELDPYMASAELDPYVEPATELDPAVPAFAAASTPVLPSAPYKHEVTDSLEDLDPIFEPEAQDATVPPVAVAHFETAPHFEIEDVIDAGDADPAFDLAGLLDADPEPAPQPAAAFLKPLSSFDREPLALRDGAIDERAGELHEWLNRVRERRFNSVSQLMAG